MTSDITLTSALGSAQKTEQQGVKLAKDFTQFLTLLTAQLQNQDPLNPMDSTEFTNQLVQFSQVEQSINSNQKLDNLVNLQLSNMPTVALGYVGMDITYKSADMNFDGNTPVKINYALEKNAAKAKMNVFDEKGKLIYSADAEKGAGAHEVQWDGSLTAGGKATNGTYSVRIDAFDSDDVSIKATTAVTGRVHGIETQNGALFLLVGQRAVALGNVINAVKPEDPAPQQQGT